MSVVRDSISLLDALNCGPAPVHPGVIVLREEKKNPLPSQPPTPCAPVVVVSMETLSSRPSMWRAPLQRKEVE